MLINSEGVNISMDHNGSHAEWGNVEVGVSLIMIHIEKVERKPVFLDSDLISKV